jgi:hypothetical protein
VLGLRLRELEEASYIGPMAQGLVELQEAGRLRAFDAVAMAHLINGAMGDTGIWVVAQDDPGGGGAGQGGAAVFAGGVAVLRG